MGIMEICQKHKDSGKVEEMMFGNGMFLVGSGNVVQQRAEQTY